MAKKEPFVLPPKEKRIYTDAELEQFDLELKPYKDWVTLPDGREVFVLLVRGEEQFLKDQKAISTRPGYYPAVKINNIQHDEYGDIKSYDEPIFAVLTEKLSQWTYWHGENKEIRLVSKVETEVPDDIPF